MGLKLQFTLSDGSRSGNRKALLDATLKAVAMGRGQPGTGWNVVEIVSHEGHTIGYQVVLDTAILTPCEGLSFEQVLWIAPGECWPRLRKHPFSRGDVKP